MQQSNALYPPIRTQDIRTLFRARELVERFTAQGLDATIEFARSALVAGKSRRQYLQEMLPAHIACAIPSGGESFIVDGADARRFHIQSSSLPLYVHIAHLEQKHETQIIRVIHSTKNGYRVYWL